MNYNFDQQVDRTGTSSQKWERYRGQDVLPLWVADTDFVSPPEVIDAIKVRTDHGVFGYTDTPDSLNQVFIERMEQLYHWHLIPEQLCWLPGLVCGLHLAARSATQPHQSVMTATPIYPPFMTAPRLSERELITIPMKQEHGRSLIDFDALDSALTDDTGLLLFCNPHNPGGTVYRREELEELAAWVVKNNLIICSDEIHCDLILEPDVEHIPLASLGPEIAERTITLMAPSKTWNIAGLGCSVAVIENPELRARFQRTRKGIVPDVNLLGYTAAEAAYRYGEPWRLQQIEYLRKTRDLLVTEINKLPKLALSPFEATYLAWIDVRELDLEDPPHFFEQAGVGLSPGRDFGEAGFMRLNFGCPRARIEEAIRRISAALG